MDDLTLTLLEYVKLALFLGNIAIAAFVVYHRSRATTQSSSSSGDAAEGERPRVGAVLFVIAHPDDEAMFFVPSILALARANRPIHLLCLSTGDYEGGPSAGKVRTKELYASASGVLGIERGRIAVVDDEELRDGPLNRWCPDRIARIVADYVAGVEGGATVETVITFDEGGVSAHPNHIAVHHGVARFLAIAAQSPSSASTAASSQNPSSASAAGASATTLARRAVSTSSSPSGEGGGGSNATSSTKPLPELRGFKLETTNLVRKYVGPIDVIWSSLTSPGELFVAPGWGFWSAHRAMQAHASQYVWFRRLYVPFSRYSYINTLLPIATTSTTIPATPSAPPVSS